MYAEYLDARFLDLEMRGRNVNRMGTPPLAPLSNGGTGGMASLLIQSNHFVPCQGTKMHWAACRSIIKGVHKHSDEVWHPERDT